MEKAPLPLPSLIRCRMALYSLQFGFRKGTHDFMRFRSFNVVSANEVILLTGKGMFKLAGYQIKVLSLYSLN